MSILYEIDYVRWLSGPRRKGTKQIINLVYFDERRQIISPKCIKMSEAYPLIRPNLT